MGISWHWSSDVWLRIFVQLHVSPIIVKGARESRIWMSVSWHWASDIRLWVLRYLNSVYANVSEQYCYNKLFH